LAKADKGKKQRNYKNYAWGGAGSGSASFLFLFIIGGFLFFSIIASHIAA
jgi:hypothetical protein